MTERLLRFFFDVFKVVFMDSGSVISTRCYVVAGLLLLNHRIFSDGLPDQVWIFSRKVNFEFPTISENAPYEHCYNIIFVASSKKSTLDRAIH